MPSVPAPSLLLYFALSASLCVPGHVWAQQTAADQERSTVEATPASEIRVDGRLQETAWTEATSISDFRQFEPDEGAAATHRTDVRVLYGEDHLYVGARMHDQDPSRVQATMGRRDEWNRADWFLISIDSDLDRRQAFAFGVSAAGVQLDATRSSGGQGGGGGGALFPRGLDTSWDAVWYSDVRLTSEGWMAELKIPYSMLRFSSAETQRWGIHFTRTIPRLGEQAEWPLVPREERTNLVSQFGYVTGITGIESRRNVQVRPYTLSRARAEESEQVPGTAEWDRTFDVGGDVKVGLGPNSILDVTVNPDFGQVESDPAVLNLSAFETFFDEKRPFFVEGINKFEFSAGPGELLYTRRIGAQAPIVGAAKFSGRTEGDLSYGVLGATTGQSFDPTRHYGVARLKQQLGRYSSVGGIVTGMSAPREETPDRRSSLTGGADWDLRFGDNRYGVEGFAAFTHLRPAPAEQDSRAGAAGKTWLRKRQGDWTGFVGLDVFGDQFNPNDLGQLRENNMVVMLASVEHNINGGESFGPFQRASVRTFNTQSFSYQNGLNQGLSLEVGTNWVLRGFQRIEVSAEAENPFGGYDLYETRGLGPWAEPAQAKVEAEFTTDSRRSWEIEPEAGFTMIEDGGRSYAAGLRGNVDVGTRLSLSANVEAEWERSVTAWSANEALRRTDGGWQIGTEARRTPARYLSLGPNQLDQTLQGVEPITTSPRRYFVPVFGERDTRSIDVTTRGTITFTPQLSLQLYGQLFVAQGTYDRFQILQDRDTLVPLDAYPKQNEFAIQSLQSNSVLRWQYRPGSTIFLVWTHGRRANPSANPLARRDRSLYERSFRDHVADALDLFPRNTFTLKVSYTFLR
ncbi:hypothetical protein BSZ35_12535 [Salinibacter sp. 10B]|uniref:DUF5916 domain-containing protein n=1 Tax=Salinibacter sp. 10B TaxID=1923971 RepID=UPI000CF4BB9C|nr:DUF5916 domain-containing protein [Salinibacter sp. 10B]PQJ35316.1 hypothetical protein BSZ35_12535 [Salinibacter sp. 10B]